MKRDSLLRRRVTDAFMELQAFRDRTVEVMEAIGNSRSRELVERLVREILEDYPAHKAEVRKLLTVDGKIIPIDDKRRWTA